MGMSGGSRAGPRRPKGCGCGGLVSAYGALTKRQAGKWQKLTFGRN